MLYISILIIAIILFVLESRREKHKRWETPFPYVFAVVITSVIGIIGCGSIILSGLITFPSLLELQEKYEAYDSYLEQIQSAHYENTNIDNINIPLDNMNQSTNLSDYIAKLAYHKSKFNTRLRGAQTMKTYTLYYWIANSMFIHPAVMDMKYIE